MASSSVVRPFLEVPGLTEIRNILAQLEAPIVSALTERMNLPTDPSLYSDGGAKLLSFMSVRESIAAASGRYDYGRLEYPFTLPLIAQDITTPSNSFPPGRFHQDTYSGNANITSFYLNTLVPFFNSSTSFFYHLDNSTFNPDATFNLDATLLALLSHRAHIGKVVAETKFASNVSAITQMIQTNDTSAILAAVTNTTQEAGVYAQASAAAMAFSNAWLNSGALELTSFNTTLQSATYALFQELIAITTEIEVQYLLQRLD
ncbi:chorismate mutase [Gloeophyllum trabeum ATCC 11539]|uniref:chorismate mutase n=1 Tax=Gloeophyllum trabeum (strain ATCC 11539 / FP-39264 / Madison 617) TaxID=670483 RepID=S7R6U3_GLOTA|nr:chorismate mutase [Gloeophyllum trabeum ATCC 11539]EPQ50105.1 chorismate mutase [Gloeophyllum trabeum ATCC 11539]